GRVFLAEEAKELGVVNQVFAPEELVDRTREYAKDLIKHCSPRSMATIKAETYRHWNMELTPAVKEANELMVRSFGFPDFKEGVQSCVHRRNLDFHHVYAPAAPRWPLVSRVLGLEEGPAVLSRFPIVTSHVHPIDRCGGLYRRVLVCAELATPRGPLEACSTHLDGSDCHAERVASILGARPRTAPLLLMGDLNATEQSKGIRNLIAALGLVDTFREANPAAPGF